MSDLNRHVRAKICGITRIEDALCAIECGASALGFVFYEPSPRAIAIEKAKAIVEALPPFVSFVGLFVDAESDFVKRVCSAVPLNLLQFHGEETPEQCERYDLPYIKAVRVRTKQCVVNAEREFDSALGILADTYKDGVQGGTGEVFDWSLLPQRPSKPLILAGGLNPDNVRNAIVEVNPYAVDVSGGVEASKGIKSPELIKRFLNEVSRGS